MKIPVALGTLIALLLGALAAVHAADGLGHRDHGSSAARGGKPCRVGAYYFGMWSPAAFHVMKGFPFARPDFYMRAETPVEPVYSSDGTRITGYVPQGLVTDEDWWVGVKDLWDKERCWPADPADASEAYLSLRKGDFSHLRPVIGYYDLTKPETIRHHIAQARAFGLEFFNFYWYWNSFTHQEELNTGLEQFLGVDGNPMKFAISICQHGGPFVVWGNEESAARRNAEPSCFDVAIGKLVGYVKRDNYLRTSDGRPIIYLMAAEGIVNEKTDAAGQVVGAYEPQGNTIEKFIGMLRSEVQKATGHAPLIVVGANDREYPHQKPDGSMGTVLASAFADAVTRVAPKRGTDALGEDEQKYGLPVMPGFTQNFDERPRYGCIKNPPCWYDPTDTFRKNFQQDLAQLKAWMDEQPREESRILSIYAWNEWHEGGIIEPNVRDGARYLDMINTVFQLPRNPCDPALLESQPAHATD
jgi:hypothetical protein